MTRRSVMQQVIDFVGKWDWFIFFVIMVSSGISLVGFVFYEATKHWIFFVFKILRIKQKKKRKKGARKRLRRLKKATEKRKKMESQKIPLRIRVHYLRQKIQGD